METIADIGQNIIDLNGMSSLPLSHISMGNFHSSEYLDVILGDVNSRSLIIFQSLDEMSHMEVQGLLDVIIIERLVKALERHVLACKLALEKLPKHIKIKDNQVIKDLIINIRTQQEYVTDIKQKYLDCSFKQEEV